MPRKLKTYQTSQGFYDLAIAAPSMKAALEAWGASSNLFHQGFAKEAEDSKVIAAAMEKPGIVLRRPVGSDAAFSEHSDLPNAASLDAPRRPGEAKPKKVKPVRERKVDEKAERRAAAAYEKEQQRRERQRQKEEATAAKARAQRKAAMEKAETALSDAEREHNEAAAAIEEELDLSRENVMRQGKSSPGLAALRPLARHQNQHGSGESPPHQADATGSVRRPHLAADRGRDRKCVF